MMATEIEPIRKVFTVETSPERAFELFTSHMGEWWPLATHSVGPASTGVTMEEGVGGRIVEALSDGSSSVWGTVTRWEPPQLLEFSWHAGTEAATATTVSVAFRPGDDGRTLVELVHAGWQNRPDGAEMRRGYETGWDPVITRFEALANAASQ